MRPRRRQVDGVLPGEPQLPTPGRTRGGGPSEVEIHDGRSADLPGWEECGFELLRHASSVPEWADDQIAGVHYVEMEELACKLTGADVALVSGHITRSPQDAR